MNEFYALRIAGEDGYLGHFDLETDAPVPVMLQHALFYKRKETFAELGLTGQIVKVTFSVEEVSA